MQKISPALREDFQSLLSAAKANPALRDAYRSRMRPGLNPDAQRLFDISLDAHQILTLHICQLAMQFLTGVPLCKSSS